MARGRRPLLNPPKALRRIRLSAARLSQLMLRVSESKVIRRGVKTPCWEWLGHKDKNGYGQVSVGGRTLWTHRAFFAIFNGPIPTGREIDHRCHNPSCCNPHHLLRKHPLKHATESAQYGARCRTSTPSGRTRLKPGSKHSRGAPLRTTPPTKGLAGDDGKDIPF